MKKLIFTIALIFVTCCAHADTNKCSKVPVKIAIIDSGFGFKDLGHTAHLCRFGHKDFSIDRQFSHAYDTKDLVPVDLHGHGTNVVGVIDGYASQAHINYCFVIIKYYSMQQTGPQNAAASMLALTYVSNIRPDYVNYSGGGPEWIAEEFDVVKRYLNGGGHMVAAAGNDNHNLDYPVFAYYPAMYDPRIVVVGNLGKDGLKSESSNYGEKVTRWEVGEAVTAYGITMSGTSQATAVATGKIVANSNNKCDIGF